jgi:hypothetical protein
MPRKVSSARTTTPPARSEPVSVLDRLLLQLAGDNTTSRPIREWARRLLRGEAAAGPVGTGPQEGGEQGRPSPPIPT